MTSALVGEDYVANIVCPSWFQSVVIKFLEETPGSPLNFGGLDF
jgi:hypothetical protein